MKNITFDASGSYDIDGEIMNYNWIFKDGEEIKKEIIQYLYIFENTFNIEDPLIFTVHLYVEDDHDSKVFASHQIKLYPEEFKFYFLKNSLISNLPKSFIEILIA